MGGPRGGGGGQGQGQQRSQPWRSRPSRSKLSRSPLLRKKAARRARLSSMTPTTPKSMPYDSVTSGGTVYESASTFEDLKLPPELLKGLHDEMGFNRPSKIQAITLPMILTPSYKNLVA
ncbi:hypothetical protein PR202_ga27002 [Eleusine coracana subsp. coracana]|uniref:DEAD-box RNA helicase Q domain-containing protein n=1 Tax=Eleusine coracana subsp. coracana TaxID=191504 RepID=A0AAV5DF11_ELECO|nr:hypothetical protein PR202_ga27002 [Eleusine coracana subsp. coracana]